MTPTKLQQVQGTCGTPEAMIDQIAEAVRKWPDPLIISAWLENTPAQYERWQVEIIMQAAWCLWQEVQDFTFRFADGPDDANVLIDFQSIDGPAGTLAWATLPDVTKDHQVLSVRFDAAERWDFCTHCKRGTIDLLRVAAHEFGHTLGIGHNHNPQQTALMDPTIGPVRTPQAWDRAQFCRRYATDLGSL